jgi:hypothetical protein
VAQKPASIAGPVAFDLAEVGHRRSPSARCSKSVMPIGRTRIDTCHRRDRTESCLHARLDVSADFGCRRSSSLT